MKTIVVLSDTHGSKKGVESLMPIIRENNFVFHLGDGVSEFGAILGGNPLGFYFCVGNCDGWGGWQRGRHGGDRRYQGLLLSRS